MPLDSNYPFLADEVSFARFLRAFEDGTWPHADWTHAAHVAMAAWYLLSLPEQEVADRVRTNIRHYNECAGVANTPDSGYHETLTLFWLEVIGAFLRGQPPPLRKLDAIRAAVRQFGPQRDLFRRYYSFDVVKSREARARWVAPDRPTQVPGTRTGSQASNV